MQRVNYQKELDRLIEQLDSEGLRPRLLMHSCCAPCSSYCIEYLSKHFGIELYFYNPNMDTAVEYDRRAGELKRLVHDMWLDGRLGPGGTEDTVTDTDDTVTGADTGIDTVDDMVTGTDGTEPPAAVITPAAVTSPAAVTTPVAVAAPVMVLAPEGDTVPAGVTAPEETTAPVAVTVADYDPESFLEIARGHETDPERGERCRLCYELRLRATARYMKEYNRQHPEAPFDYFATTLTLSPLKDAAALNDIAERVADEYGLRCLKTDFKKRDGYKRSIELSREYGLYRQNYCGCRYSKRAAEPEDCNQEQERRG